MRTAILAGLVAGALHAPTALGQAAWPNITFSGYGTLGAVHSGDDQADYLVDAFKPNGPGYSRDVSWDVDSRLGQGVRLGRGRKRIARCSPRNAERTTARARVSVAGGRRNRMPVRGVR